MKRVLDIGGRSKGLIGDIGGWKNVQIVSVNLHSFEDPDIIADAVKLEGVADEAYDGIYSSHTIEHVHYLKTEEMFNNWFKKLVGGGRLEIRCPDVEWLFENMIKGQIPEDIVPELVLGRPESHMTHHNIFWYSILRRVLEKTGFSDIRKLEYDKEWLDWWPYDGFLQDYHGLRINDLVVEAYRA